MLKKALFISCSFEIKKRLQGTYIGAVEVFDRKQGQPMKFSLNRMLSECTGLCRCFLEITIGKVEEYWHDEGYTIYLQIAFPMLFHSCHIQC